jgi:hypothetical protein
MGSSVSSGARREAGAYALQVGGAGRRRAFALAIGALAVDLAATLLVFRGWAASVQGVVAILALFVITWLVFERAERTFDVALPWLRGGRAERRVGEALAPLEQQGWEVQHDVDDPRGGNIDHVVCGPAGVFALETKLRRYEAGTVGQVKGRAARLSPRLGGRWVQPVVVLVERDDQPRQRDRVWIMGLPHLRSWLAAQPRRVGRPPSLASLALEPPTPRARRRLVRRRQP